MQLVEQTILTKVEFSDDQLVDIRLLKESPEKFHVIVHSGRKGQRLRESSKTPFGKTKPEAEEIYAKTVALWESREYLKEGGEETAQETPSEPTKTASRKPKMIPFGSSAQRDAVKIRLRYPNEKRSSDWPLSRVLWRAGQLRLDELDSIIPPLLSTMSKLEGNSAAWALAQTDSPKPLQLLEELTTRFPDSPSIKRHHTRAVAKQNGIENSALSSITKAALGQPHFADYLLSEKFASSENASSDIDLLYHLKEARDAIVEFCRQAPIKEHYFRLIRALYKTSEAAADMEVHGILALRFELSPTAASHTWEKVGKRWQQVKKGVFGPGSKLYLRKRPVRFLNQLAEDGNIGDFINMAMGILLSLDSETPLNPSQKTSQYVWNNDLRRSEMVDIYAPIYGQLHTYSWLTLGGNDFTNKSQTLKYTYASSTNPANLPDLGRFEPHSQLWDQAPDAIIHLLSHGQVEDVHRFARAIWAANPGFKNELKVEHIISFLKTPFQKTKELALSLAVDFWDPKNPNTELIIGLAHSGILEAEDLALNWTSQVSKEVASNADFLATLFTINSKSVHERLRGIFTGLITSSGSVAQLTVEKLLAATEAEKSNAKLAFKTLNLLAPDQVKALTPEHAENLLRHEREYCQWFGIKLVTILTKQGITIDSNTWSLAIDSPFKTVRAVGTKFIESLSPDQLAENIDLISACCRSPHSELRKGMHTSVSSLAQSHPKLAEELVLELFPILLRAEEHEGVHTDTITLLRDHLDSSLHVIPAEYNSQILESEHAAAQELGFILLKNFTNLAEQPLPEIITWANHPHQELRVWVIEYLSANERRLLAELDEISPLVESDWTDVRDYSFDLLRKRVPEERWNVDSLIKLCDSILPAVQDFGKEMITRRFREEDGELYLTHLSQHPTKEMQFFVTHFLEQHASDSPELILKLKHFFQTAFGVVNSARLTKSRSQQFLQKEALKSLEVATMAHGLFYHFSATCTIQDKAFYIQSLSTLEQTWPQLSAKLNKPELKQWKAS